MRAEEFAKLYDFASRYAKVCRSKLIEADEAAQEMMLVALQCRFKSQEYVKQAMRNRYVDLLRREKMLRGFHVPLEEMTEEPRIEPEPAWEAHDLVARLLLEVGTQRAIILNHILAGRTAREIQSIERITSRTVYRYLAKARQVVEAISN